MKDGHGGPPYEPTDTGKDPVRGMDVDLRQEGDGRPAASGKP